MSRNVAIMLTINNNLSRFHLYVCFLMRFAPSELTTAILAVLSTSTYAASENTALERQVALLPIVFEAQETVEVGKTVYSKEDLEKVPNSKKTITDFLRVNPNVQFSNNSMNAGTQGNLSPAEISINGGLPYNNAFLIDGVNVGNRINPIGTSSVNHANDLMGSSQQANINTDLICELEVLDSNVSAAYGAFSGGVVSAKTCAPKSAVGEIHGQVSYDYEDSDWHRYNFYSADEKQKFDAATEANYQQNYIKQGLSATAYGRLTEKLGFSAGASRRVSDIEMQPKLGVERNYDQSRQSDNLSLDLYYQANPNTEVQVGVKHFESNDLYFQNNVLHNGMNMLANSNSALVKVTQNLATVKLEQTLSYQEKDSERRSDSHSSKTWYSSANKNWSTTNSATEGDFGSLAQQHKNLSYKIQADFQPLIINNWRHTWAMGAGVEHDEANWQRPNDHYSYGVQQMGYGTDCIRLDGSMDTSCDASYVKGALNGQYHTRYTYNPAATIDVRQDSWHAYLENQIEWQTYVKATLGARVDYDSLTKNNNVAPRSSFNLMPLGDKRLTLTTGWNRYYSNNAFTYQLQDGINDLDQSFKRDHLNSPWEQTSSTSAVNVQRSELDTPYSDEVVAAISSEIKQWKYQFKYVHRDYRDEIRLTPITQTPDPYDRIYDNVGSGEADIFTLSIKNEKPFAFLGADHALELGIDYTDLVRNFNHYDVTTLNEDMYVIHDGKLMLNTDRPAVNYNQPYTARLSWDLKLHQLPLRISNLFVYRSGYDYYSRSLLPTAERFTHEGHTVRYSYSPEQAPSRFNWNMRTSYSIPFGQSEELTFGLTMNNLLNKRQKYIAIGDSDSLSMGSELGRQFIADVSFKF